MTAEKPSWRRSIPGTPWRKFSPRPDGPYRSLSMQARHQRRRTRNLHRSDVLTRKASGPAPDDQVGTHGRVQALEFKDHLGPSGWIPSWWSYREAPTWAASEPHLDSI